MKTLSILLVTMAAAAGSWAPPALAQDLTRKQEKAALREMDNICGDTWCEGDHDFSFDSLRCDFRTEKCLMGYRFWEPASDDAKHVHKQRGSCTITGIRSSADVVVFHERWAELNEKVYEQLTNCLH